LLGTIGISDRILDLEAPITSYRHLPSCIGIPEASSWSVVYDRWRSVNSLEI
jgi:hypothetical protein